MKFILTLVASVAVPMMFWCIWWIRTRCSVTYTDYGMHDYWVHCKFRHGHSGPHSFEREPAQANEQTAPAEREGKRG
jgi:hypothetical protein